MIPADYTERTKDLIIAYCKAVNEKDLEGAMACVSKNIKVTMKAKGTQDSVRHANNQDELKEVLKRIFEGFNSVLSQGERTFTSFGNVVTVRFDYCLEVTRGINLNSKVKQEWVAEEIENKMLLTLLKAKETSKTSILLQFG